MGVTRSCAPSADQIGAERHAVLGPQSAVPVEQGHALAHGEPEHGEQAGDGGQAGRTAVEPCGEHAAGEGHDQGCEGDGAHPPARERGLQEQEDAHCRGEGEAEHAPLCPLLVGVVRQQLGVILDGVADRRELRLDPVGHLADVVALDVGRDVDEAGDVSVLDDRRGGPHPHGRHVAQADMTAVRGVDQQALDPGQARAGVRRAPDDHVEDLLVLEQVADPEAGQHGRGGSADIAGLDAVRSWPSPDRPRPPWSARSAVTRCARSPRRPCRRRPSGRPSAVVCSVSRLSLPKTRTVIWSCVGLSTSVIRFFV